MGIKDLFITPIFLILLLFVAYTIRPYVTTKYTKPYFIPGIMVKFIGAIAIGVIYQFYYSWGDTYTFFREARIIWEIFINNPINGLRIIFQNEDSLKDLFSLTNRLWTFGRGSNFNFVKILSFVNLFTFNTYSSTALLLASFSFSGAWVFFSIIYKKYNHSIKMLALSVFFIPSVTIWGSGIFKDTISLGALLWLSWVFFQIAEYKKINLWTILVGVLSIMLLAYIKIYILMCFLPIGIVYINSKYLQSIKNLALKILILPFFLTVAIATAFFSVQEAGNIDQRYSIDKVAQTAMVTAYDIRYYSGADAGSGYSLGNLDGSLGSMLNLTLPAINVSLFRPYLWEVSNPLMLLSAIESVTFLCLTIWMVFRKGKNLFRIMKNPFIMMCFSFSVIFAFAVGVSTFNFGTLVRYKIPLMPFYGIFLTFIYHSIKKR